MKCRDFRILVECFIKTYHCRYKIVVFSLSILMSNDNKIRTASYVFSHL